MERKSMQANARQVCGRYINLSISSLPQLSCYCVHQVIGVKDVTHFCFTVVSIFVMVKSPTQKHQICCVVYDMLLACASETSK